MRVTLPLLLLLTACTGRHSPDSGDSAVDSQGDSVADDSTPDSDTQESGDSHGDSQDSGPDCTLADPLGQIGITLQSGDDAAVYYTDGDTPLMADGYQVVLSIKGTTGSGGVPVETPYATAGFGYLQVYVNVPKDRRGAGSRAAVAATARFAAGLEPDAQGCYLADLVSVPVSATPPLVLGHSNGGVLAIATLADATLDLPAISGIVTFETPISAQFVDVELGAVNHQNPLYLPGSCAWDPLSGLECAYSSTPVLGWDPTYQDGGRGPIGAVFFDADGNGTKSVDEYPVFGVGTVVDEPTVAFSPQMTRLIEAQGLEGPTRLDLADADAWWADRDGSRLAVAALENHPGVPLIAIGTLEDHVAGVSDHAHITAEAQIWRDSGSPWVRVNPAPVYMQETAGVGPSWTDNPPNLATFLGNPEVHMEPDEFDTGFAPDQYCAAALIELATRTANGDWSE